jgi:hypothetical protein
VAVGPAVGLKILHDLQLGQIKRVEIARDVVSLEIWFSILSRTQINRRPFRVASTVRSGGAMVGAWETNR